jgi:hypothetical protein
MTGWIGIRLVFHREGRIVRTNTGWNRVRGCREDRVPSDRCFTDGKNPSLGSIGSTSCVMITHNVGVICIHLVCVERMRAMRTNVQQVVAW